MYISLDLFCLIVAVTIPSAEELYFFIGVSGWLKLISLIVMRRGESVFPLWKIPPTSASETESITCLSILHYMWIFSFDESERCWSFVGADCWEIRYYFPPVRICDHGLDGYDASMSMCSTISLALNFTTAVVLVDAYSRIFSIADLVFWVGRACFLAIWLRDVIIVQSAARA